jgi:hypothetical protein
MIYGICAIAFNVVMSFDCIMYAFLSQVVSWYRPPIYFRLFSYFWHISCLSVFPYIFQAKYVGNKKINENKLVGGTTTWGTIWGPVYEHLLYVPCCIICTDHCHHHAWFFVSFRIFFSDNTRVRILFFFVVQSANFFSRI